MMVNEHASSEGDLRSGVSAGSGDPRRTGTCLESPADAMEPYIERVKSLYSGFVRISIAASTDCQRPHFPYFHVAFDQQLKDGKACYSWSEVEEFVQQRVADREVDRIALGM
ncbi:MAG: hypothetical protein JSS49_07920 [Planctomycetes bacterium]|nr:hypothetical protein [Planctomycetota bacterium]